MSKLNLIAHLNQLELVEVSETESKTLRNHKEALHDND